MDSPALRPKHVSWLIGGKHRTVNLEGGKLLLGQEDHHYDTIILHSLDVPEAGHYLDASDLMKQMRVLYAERLEDTG